MSVPQEIFIVLYTLVDTKKMLVDKSEQTYIFDWLRVVRL